MITVDGGHRRGKPSALKPAIDEALAKCPQVEHVLEVRRTGQDPALAEELRNHVSRPLADSRLTASRGSRWPRDSRAGGAGDP